MLSATKGSDHQPESVHSNSFAENPLQKFLTHVGTNVGSGNNESSAKKGSDYQPGLLNSKPFAANPSKNLLNSTAPPQNEIITLRTALQEANNDSARKALEYQAALLREKELRLQQEEKHLENQRSHAELMKQSMQSHQVAAQDGTSDGDTHAPSTNQSGELQSPIETMIGVQQPRLPSPMSIRGRGRGSPAQFRNRCVRDTSTIGFGRGRGGRGMSQFGNHPASGPEHANTSIFERSARMLSEGFRTSSGAGDGADDGDDGNSSSKSNSV